jgi:DnaJ-class molecular chaperone
MDLFKMAAQIANNMSPEDKDAIENMDMEKMISHVTKNVFTFMNAAGVEQPPIIHDFRPPPPPKEVLPRTRDICFDLNVDLLDFYMSKKKKLNIKRKCVVVVDGKQKVVEEKKRIVIPIEKGMKDEQQIRFEGQADRIPGYTPGDIVITLIETEHPVFQRDGDNLIIAKDINLYQIYDYTFDITHIDSRIIRICKSDTDALHLNNSLRKIPGLGMPVYKQENIYGDLFVRFNVVLPKTLEKLKEIVSSENKEVLGEKYDVLKVLENVSETDLEGFYTSEEEATSETESDTDSDDLSESESESGVSVSSVSD